MSDAPVLAIRGAVKQLGGTLAVGGVDFEVARGEIHALLGANGAGKSTLIKLLAGVHVLDQGEIRVHGQIVHPRVDRLPIAFIHQDLGLIEWMTVAENIALTRGYTRRGGLIAWRELDAQAERALEAVGSGISPEAPVASLSRTERSIVAIARALAANGVELLVLDEPTSSLPEADVARLFAVLRSLRERGMSMIYVTHRLDEVFRLADRATVLRDGRVAVAAAPVGGITPASLIEEIVGRPLADLYAPPAAPTADRVSPVLEVRDLEVGRGVGPVSLTLRAGEIVGLCGLRGAGQNAVGRALCGIEAITAGTVRLEDGIPLRARGGPGEVVRQGVAFVSSNREAESLGMSLSVRENLFLNPAARRCPVWRPVWPAAEAREADGLITSFSIRPRDPEQVVSTLSGGNQQKVVLARWMDTGIRVLVLEEPTLGVDVGAKAEIYTLLGRALARGLAVLLVSSDLEEVAQISHRVLSFNRGRIVTELPRAEISVARLTALVAGGAPEAAPVHDDTGSRAAHLSHAQATAR